MDATKYHNGCYEFSCHVPGPRTRRRISALIGLHLAAIVVGPWSIPPASDLVQSLYVLAGPYLEAMYLNHGYRFFAPDPGPSHLIRYELFDARGRTIRGFFPDRREHQPRLRYHRHFMLSEFVGNALASGRSDIVEETSRNFASRLAAEHGATSVRLHLIQHGLPSPAQIQQGLPLSNAQLFQERLLGHFDFDRGPDGKAGRPVLRSVIATAQGGAP
jgi:hypothetical protein